MTEFFFFKRKKTSVTSQYVNIGINHDPSLSFSSYGLRSTNCLFLHTFYFKCFSIQVKIPRFFFLYSIILYKRKIFWYALWLWGLWWKCTCTVQQDNFRYLLFGSTTFSWSAALPARGAYFIRKSISSNIISSKFRNPRETLLKRCTNINYTVRLNQSLSLFFFHSTIRQHCKHWMNVALGIPEHS